MASKSEGREKSTRKDVLVSLMVGEELAACFGGERESQSPEGTKDLLLVRNEVAEKKELRFRSKTLSTREGCTVEGLCVLGIRNNRWKKRCDEASLIFG